jgi:catechol 2,3-dioxygenase-like lactoylglutathione lyase family enzyme
MTEDRRARLVGLNHIALEVGNVEQALDFYGRIFRFELRGSHKNDEGRRVMAFLDMGDQFLALNEGRTQPSDDHRHFGLVVDDRAHVMELAKAAGATLVEGSANNFRDPWGNRIEIVEYRDVQFSKTAAVLHAMGVDGAKSHDAKSQLAKKGMA